MNAKTNKLFGLYHEQRAPYGFLYWCNLGSYGQVWQHKNDEGGAFTSSYKCHYLLYYNDSNHINKAIERKRT